MTGGIISLRLDLLVFFAGWVAGQFIFHAYEAHVPIAKRVAKLLAMSGVFVVVHVTFGRRFFYGLLALMTTGMAVLHGYWFHCRHGIHWRTAEPREKYLQLIMLSTHRKGGKPSTPTGRSSFAG